METIYKWFSFLFGSNLAEHFSGWDEATGDYTKSNLFSVIGIIALIIAIATCVAYYYVLDHPRWNRWWKWSLFLGASAIVNFLLAFEIAYSDLLAGNVSSDIANISISNCLGMGLTNIIISIAIFIICSFIIKWGSHNAKYSPF